MATNDDDPKKNREQRRDDEFGADRSGPAIQSPWTSDDVPANDSVTGQPDQDQTHLTGPGTGGATESGDGVRHREGFHPNTGPR